MMGLRNVCPCVRGGKKAGSDDPQQIAVTQPIEEMPLIHTGRAPPMPDASINDIQSDFAIARPFIGPILPHADVDREVYGTTQLFH